jgi:uncharacterized protein YfaS (alpha-2-macroglobulin family)
MRFATAARLSAICAALLLGLAPAAPVVAQAAGPLPDRRLVQAEGVDLPGGDLAMLFDTTLESCQRACLADPACVAYTFNTRSNACFPKGSAAEPVPFEGAVSGWLRATAEGAQAAATTRAEALDFLVAADLDAARSDARGLGARHVPGLAGAEEHLAAAARARGEGDLAGAAGHVGRALALTDAADLWVEYGRLLLSVRENDWSARRDLQFRALAAGVNGWLRGGTPAVRASAAVLMARALEGVGRGRDMIPALRLAQAEQPRDEVAELLETAIGRYGFRIVEHRVDNAPALPRICAVFSEELVAAGVDYTPFVQLTVPGLAVEAEGSQLCVEGVRHGERYAVTFREGLPAASGQLLSRSVRLDLYVRDRPAAVRFPGRGHVLPAAGPAAVPVETVNADRLDLVLRRVSDRNLVAAMREGLFARPLAAWQEEILTEGIAEELWRGSAEVATELNRDVTSRLPVAEIAGPMPPGVYVLRAAIPGTQPWDTASASQWFVVSDLGLTTLWGADGLHVVVRALSDAGAVEGAEVRLVSRANRVLGMALTDAQGLAVFPAGLARGTGGAAPALVTVTTGGAGEDAAPADFAFLSLTEPEFDLSDRGVAGRAAPPPVDVFVTTDRGAYRAGETVHVTALARDGAMRAIEGLPLTLRLRRPDGVEYLREAVADAGAGGHVAALPVAGNAPRGRWRLEVLADPDAAPLATAGFLVEDFLPERIDFDLALPDGAVALGDAPRLDVDVRYLFGAVGADLAVEGEVLLRARDALPGWPGFAFGRHDAPFRPLIEPLPFGTRTDEAGRARLRAQLPQTSDPGRPLEMVARVRVSEGSGRPVEREIAAPVAPGAPVIGLRPLFDGAVAEGAEAGFQVVVVDGSGAAVPARLRWVLNRVETRYQWYQRFGDWNWEPMTRRTRVAEGEIAPGAAPAALSLPVTAGRHELLVERVDGSPAAASVAFSAGWYAAGDAVETPDMLEASLDAPAYAPGATATLRIVPQRPGVALVTVMSDRLIDLKLVEVGEGETRIPLTVTDDWGTGAYVAASMLHPTDGARARGPARALGLAHAAVDPGPRRLAAVLDVPAEAAPRAPMAAVLRVEGAAPGETVHATVAAVDVGILNLTGFESPDPEGHYFGQRRLGVAIRDLYGRLIDGTEGALGVVRSGGDGGLPPALQAPPPTEELVAWFSGPVTLGPDGTAQLQVPLPAFDGTVRLMAVVWSARGVGQAEADVLVRDPVVVQASLPRFLSLGDESRLLLDFAHATGPGGRVGLDVTATGGLVLGPVPSGLDLPEGGRVRVVIPVSATGTGVQRIEVAVATPGGATLTRSLALPVEINDPEIARSSRFTLPAGASFTLDDEAFAGLRPASAFATLAVGPLARFDAAGLMAMLDRYPYGCTEQVTAAAMPLLQLSDLAVAMGLGHAADLRARVDGAVSAVLLNQSSAGGFGLWMPESGDLWLDAFVTDFLSRARAAGHAVPEPAFRSALDNLRNQLAYAPDFEADGGPWAYALMVLAREGAAAVGDLRYYADVKAEAFDTPLAAAQLGAALAAYGDQTRADAMFARALRLLEGAGPEARVWRADYGSRLRDTAGVLTLAASAGSAAVDRDALAGRLAEGLAAAGGRVSTQEAVWALMAAHALIDRPGAEGVTLDGAPLAGPLLQLPAGAPAVLANGSDREVQLTLTAFGVPEEAEPAGGTGYRIERRYVTLEGAPADPAAVAAGTRLVAVLEVIPLEDRRARLMIDDPLPAGFEIDNPNLLRGGDIGALSGLGLRDVSQHAEFRQDRFLAAVDWAGTEPFRLGYIVRAVSPGSFHHPAASVEDMYRPALRGRTASGRVTVTE